MWAIRWGTSDAIYGSFPRVSLAINCIKSFPEELREDLRLVKLYDPTDPWAPFRKEDENV